MQIIIHPHNQKGDFLEQNHTVLWKIDMTFSAQNEWHAVVHSHGPI